MTKTMRKVTLNLRLCFAVDLPEDELMAVTSSCSLFTIAKEERLYQMLMESNPHIKAAIDQIDPAEVTITDVYDDDTAECLF